jgi:hypothetical protein
VGDVPLDREITQRAIGKDDVRAELQFICMCESQNHSPGGIKVRGREFAWDANKQQHQEESSHPCAGERGIGGFYRRGQSSAPGSRRGRSFGPFHRVTMRIIDGVPRPA